MKKSAHQQRVEEFMKRAGQEVPASPKLPSSKVRKLRAKLILEEALETIEALGFSPVFLGNQGDSLTLSQISLEEKHSPSLVKIADGCADLRVVTTGTLSACGIPDEPLQKLVDENNLEKLGPHSQIREDGKLLKPPHHPPPDISGLLRQLGWKEEK